MEKNKRGFDKRRDGFLILLLVIIIPFALKHELSAPESYQIIYEENIFVQIDGKVKYPGVYAFQTRPDLYALVNRGGGLPPGVSFPVRYNNIFFNSGERVILEGDDNELVCFSNEFSAFKKFTLNIPLSINRESEEGLTAIPGIGKVLSKVIVGERNARNGFKNLEEIKSLPGIGEKIYKKILPHIGI